MAVVSRLFSFGPLGWREALFALMLAAVAAPAVPQTQPVPVKKPVVDQAGPSWQSLSPPQRSALAPLQGEWATIDASRKAKWLGIAARFPKMSPDEQRRMQTRMAEWSQLSPQERARARLTFQEAKQLPQQERQDQWQAYQALPESQRKALATRAGTTKKPTERADKPAPQLAEKRNIVGNPSFSSGQTKAVAPTVVQTAPGATTTLVTRQPAPPAHQPAGLPKIAASPGFVDRNTLLPKRGPQGAGVRGAASAPANRP